MYTTICTAVHTPVSRCSVCQWASTSRHSARDATSGACLRFAVWGLGFAVWGLGFGVCGLAPGTTRPHLGLERRMTRLALQPAAHALPTNPNTTLTPINPYVAESLCPNPTPYTTHPTPYTLHPTSYTLHPTPYTTHTPPCWHPYAPTPTRKGMSAAHLGFRV